MKSGTCLILILCLLATFAAGCSIIKPSDALVIDQNASNARAINAKVQADATLPPYVKQWWAGEADVWNSMSDWAHARKPTPSTAPAGAP